MDTGTTNFQDTESRQWVIHRHSSAYFLLLSGSITRGKDSQTREGSLAHRRHLLQTLLCPMLPRSWRRLYPVDSILWWRAFWRNPRGFNKSYQARCTDRKHYHRWAQKHSQSHQEITPRYYSSKMPGTYPAHVLVVAYTLSQAFSRYRAAWISAPNHGDQNREWPPLLDQEFQCLAWTT